MNLIEITLAGFKRMVPESLFSAYKSFGWERIQEQPQALTPEASPKPKTTKKKVKAK